MSLRLEQDITALFRRIRRLRTIKTIEDIANKENIIAGEQVNIVVTYTVKQTLYAIFGMFNFGERKFTASQDVTVASG